MDVANMRSEYVKIARIHALRVSGIIRTSIVAGDAGTFPDHGRKQRQIGRIAASSAVEINVAREPHIHLA